MAKAKKISNNFDVSKVIDKFTATMNEHEFFTKDRVSRVLHDAQLVECVTHSNTVHTAVTTTNGVSGDVSFTIDIYKSSAVVDSIAPFWKPRAIINGKFFPAVGTLHLEVQLPIVYKMNVPMIDEDTYKYKPKYNYVIMWESLDAKVYQVVSNIVEILELADKQAEENKLEK